MVQAIRAGRIARERAARKAAGQTQAQIFTEMQAALRMRDEFNGLYETLGWPEDKRAGDYNEIVDAMIDRTERMLASLRIVRSLGR